MPHSSYRNLIDRGRKAGLSTSELYTAMSARQTEPGEDNTGQTDGNGFVTAYDQSGHRVYRPAGCYPRP